MGANNTSTSAEAAEADSDTENSSTSAMVTESNSDDTGDVEVTKTHLLLSAKITLLTAQLAAKTNECTTWHERSKELDDNAREAREHARTLVLREQGLNKLVDELKEREIQLQTLVEELRGHVEELEVEMDVERQVWEEERGMIRREWEQVMREREWEWENERERGREEVKNSMERKGKAVEGKWKKRTVLGNIEVGSELSIVMEDTERTGGPGGPGQNAAPDITDEEENISDNLYSDHEDYALDYTSYTTNMHLQDQQPHYPSAPQSASTTPRLLSTSTQTEPLPPSPASQRDFSPLPSARTRKNTALSILTATISASAYLLSKSSCMCEASRLLKEIAGAYRDPFRGEESLGFNEEDYRARQHEEEGYTYMEKGDDETGGDGDVDTDTEGHAQREEEYRQMARPVMLNQGKHAMCKNIAVNIPCIFKPPPRIQLQPHPQPYLSHRWARNQNLTDEPYHHPNITTTTRLRPPTLTHHEQHPNPQRSPKRQTIPPYHGRRPSRPMPLPILPTHPTLNRNDPTPSLSSTDTYSNPQNIHKLLYPSRTAPIPTTEIEIPVPDPSPSPTIIELPFYPTFGTMTTTTTSQAPPISVPTTMPPKQSNATHHPPIQTQTHPLPRPPTHHKPTPITTPLIDPDPSPYLAGTDPIPLRHTPQEPPKQPISRPALPTPRRTRPGKSRNGIKPSPLLAHIVKQQQQNQNQNPPLITIAPTTQTTLRHKIARAREEIVRIERENEELEKFLVGGGRGRFGEIQSIKERREEGEEDRKGWNTGDLLDGGDGIVV